MIACWRTLSPNENWLLWDYSTARPFTGRPNPKLTLRDLLSRGVPFRILWCTFLQECKKFMQSAVHWLKEKSKELLHFSPPLLGKRRPSIVWQLYRPLRDSVSFVSPVDVLKRLIEILGGPIFQFLLTDI